ncbi:MAG: sigma 54-interacting transcriptional regulator, partial [Myxococcales bacterium]|nr:sigma 54-interacting transcriptional regulator [Myxococcales bacterium]
NAGVVALYRGLWDDARAMLERSLEQKRALGDLAGTRACLLNLGIAHTKARAWSSADAALGEACRLAETLGQRAGLGWCIAARAELALRRGDAAAALLSAREADALRDALPPPVIADIALIRAEAFAELGDGEAAHRALGEVGAELRASDRALSARAELARAKTLLASAPADPRAAARAAVRAAREARAAGLADLEALARETLTRARPPRARSPEPMHTPPSSVEPLVASVLARIASGEPAQRSMEALLAAIVTAAGAERAFLVRLDARAAVAGAVAVDLDGLPLASAAERVPLEITSRAAASDGLVFHRDVEASARRGSRLALRAGSSTVLVLEHRFAPGAFDALTRERVEPWALLGAVLARIDDDARLREDPAGAIVAPARAAPASPSASSAASAAPWSTELPTATAGRTYREIVGDGAAMRKAKARLDAAVDSDLPVLLLGETGTGKEVFARALHAHGPRARGPLVAINCAAIPDSLFEAELFGHARGAFTGAERARPGLLSRADGGTLFLDEVGELSPSRQATLLRALETRRFRPVGIDEERPFDVRVCAATNRDLASDPAFRRDLYFRLGVLTITLPPLRERTEDIPLLLERFFEERGARVELSPRALSALSAYAWPGNVRELLHEALRLTTLRVSRADASHLSRAIRAADQARPPRADKERAEVERALARTGGNITHAAELLGLTRHGLKKRMLRLGLRGKEERRA